MAGAPINKSSRAEVKRISREKDDRDLESGVVSSVELSRINGGGIRSVKHIGPSLRMKRLAAKE